MSIDERMDKQIVVYTENGMLLIHKKEVLIYYNMDKLPKHFTKWKRPDTKGHMLYHSIYVKDPEQINP